MLIVGNREGHYELHSRHLTVDLEITSTKYRQIMLIMHDNDAQQYFNVLVHGTSAATKSSVDKKESYYPTHDNSQPSKQ
jgi:stress response protein SCP2